MTSKHVELKIPRFMYTRYNQCSLNTEFVQFMKISRLEGFFIKEYNLCNEVHGCRFDRFRYKFISVYLFNPIYLIFVNKNNKYDKY